MIDTTAVPFPLPFPRTGATESEIKHRRWGCCEEAQDCYLLHLLCKQKEDYDIACYEVIYSGAFNLFQLFSSSFIWSCTYFQRTSSCSLMVPSSVMSTMIAWGLVVKKFMLSHVTTPTRIVASPRSSVTCRDKHIHFHLTRQSSVMYMERRTLQAQICSEAHNKLKNSILSFGLLNCREPISPQGICCRWLAKRREKLGRELCSTSDNRIWWTMILRKIKSEVWKF